MLIDTHCHIHDTEFYSPQESAAVYKQAIKEGVELMICVGTDAKSSQQAIDFSQANKGCYGSIAIHPHDAQDYEQQWVSIESLGQQKSSKLVAIGECGLDYFYLNSSKKVQQLVLEKHFQLAKQLDLPMIYHIRGSKENPNDAFEDFWKIYDNYKTKGVVHSFSAYNEQLQQIINRKLKVGINGIITFTNSSEQLQAMLSVPLENLVLETDSPFLTPKPNRGKPNTPANLNNIAQFIANNREEDLSEIIKATNNNAKELFKL